MRRCVSVVAMIVMWCGVCVPTVSAADKGADVNGVVRALDAQYHLHGQRVPLMWMVNAVATVSTHGGVHGMQVVRYEGLPSSLDRGALVEMVRRQLDGGWSLMVRERSMGKGGEDNMVWTQAYGKDVRMLVMNLDGDELNLVQMQMNPETLAQWDKEKGY